MDGLLFYCALLKALMYGSLYKQVPEGGQLGNHRQQGITKASNPQILLKRLHPPILAC